MTAGYKEHRRRRAVLPEIRGQDLPSHSGHPHISNNEIDDYTFILPTQERQGFDSVPGFDDGIAFTLENPRHVRPQTLLIVNY